jgi:copper(I)-binding protein
MAALVAGAALAVAGCSAGQLTQTANQKPAVPGANVNAGTIALRNLLVQYNGIGGYPAGADAPLEVRIFNDGVAPVTLIAATSDQAAAITLVGGAAVTATPAPTSEPAAASPSPPASPAASPTGSPQATASPAASAGAPSPSAAAPPVASSLAIRIPPQSYVALIPGEGSHLRLTGLKEAVDPGDWVTVTFRFDNGVSVPVQIPLVAPPGVVVPRATPVVPPGEGSHE